MDDLKVFISSPMNSDDEYKNNIDKAKKEILEKYSSTKNVIFLDSYINEDCKAKHIPVWYLGKSLEILAEADLAYFCKGWNATRGCKIENQVARLYNIYRMERF